MIRRSTTWPALRSDVQRRLDSTETFVVTGYGDRAANFLWRIKREFPDVDVEVLASTQSVGHVAIFKDEPVAWYSPAPRDELERDRLNWTIHHELLDEHTP